MQEPPLEEESTLLTINAFASLQGISRRSVFTLFCEGMPKVKQKGLGVRVPMEEAAVWLLSRIDGRNMERSCAATAQVTPSTEKAQIPLTNTVTSAKLSSQPMQKKQDSNYSLSYNQKRGVWMANIRRRAGEPGTAWFSRTLPKRIGEHQRIEAEAELFNWLPGYLKTGVTKTEVPQNRTISFFAPRWLDHRNKDGRTSPNTLRGFRQCLSTWILNNPNFQHLPIQDLDIETQLTVQVLLRWIDSLGRSPSSKLSQISTLRSLLNDAIALGWLSEELSNPLNKPAILSKEKALKEKNESCRVNAFLSLEQLLTLLSFQNTYMTDYKRMRYLLAATTGLRDSEIQSLQWKDLDLNKGTLRVNKQLYKRGSLPMVDYFQARQTLSAEEIEALPSAVTKDPKYDSKRILPLHSLTLEALRYWKKVGWVSHTKMMLPSEESPVFPRSATSLKPGEKAGAFTSPDSSDGFQVDLGRAGIPVLFEDAMGQSTSLTFHSLRHSYSHLLDGVGAGAELIGVLLGHAAKSMGRQIYIPANIEKWREVVDQIPLSSVSFSARTVGKPVKLSLVKKASA